jgi:hypothetical protein
MPGNKIINAPENLKFASDLIGLRVVNKQQERVGEVIDLLVSFSQSHPAFAIISSGRFSRRKHRFAVPVTALIGTDTRGTVIVNADSETLNQAPPFTLQVWDSQDAATSARFYNCPDTE